MKRMVIIALVSLVIAAGLYIERVNHQQDLMVDNLLRLHVIANSDSPQDQALKNQVRDRLIKEIGHRVAGMETKQEVLDFLLHNIEIIETAASEEVAAHNASYGIKAETGRFEFPTKLYGDLALPAGKYDALRVVIGDGEGSNWWCVMFPPLCFVDTDSSVILARDQERVKDMLTEEEFQLLMSSQHMDEIPVKVRFKIIELINMSKLKLAQVFGR